MTKLDRKPEYVWMKWPNFEISCGGGGVASLTARRI